MKLVTAFLISFMVFTTVHASTWMKGADLYSWKESTGQVWYALLPGTNRTKHSEELLNAKITSSELISKLKQMPKNTDVSWNNSVGFDNTASLKLTLPSKSESRVIKKKMAELGLKLHGSGL
jgi:hypothetical protein